MNTRFRGIRGISPHRHHQARHLVKRIEDRGYTVTTDDYRKEITCTASSPQAGRTLIATGDDAFSAIRNLAIVLGIVRDTSDDQTEYVLRSSSR
jgi:hypothetical protein